MQSVVILLPSDESLCPVARWSENITSTVHALLKLILLLLEVLVVKSTTQSYCCSQLAEDVGKELEFFEVYKMWTNTI